MKKTQQGFIIPLVIVVIAAFAVGGSVYYTKNKSANSERPEEKTGVQGNGELNAEANAKVKTDVSLGGKGKGSLRSLLAMTKDTMCTYSGTSAGTTVSGTMYLSGGMMRGDFVTTSQSSGSVDSHMIKNGDTMFVWSGNQGAKMDMKMLDQNADANQKGSVDLNQDVDYTCKDWTKDASKFVIPTTVTFVDIAAMMNQQMKINVGGAR
jgi:hypothetical protein